jgi:preprotein translocase subunit YajC
VTAFFCQLFILAAAQPAQPPQQGDPNAGIRNLLVVAGMVLMAYFLFIRPMKQKEQEARKLVLNLKENDRVVTIGGIFGVVTNVQRDVERVTVRVDESTGTKLKMNISAIARVVKDDDSQASATGTNK